MYTVKMHTSSVLVLLTSLLVGTHAQGLVNPVAFTLPRPPTLAGPLKINNALNLAEKLHGFGQLLGPASIVVQGENVFVATTGGDIYNAASCVPKLVASLRPPVCGAPRCGRVVSMREDPTTRWLLVLDTQRGLYAVNPGTGESQLLFSAGTPIEGRAPRHLNDFVVTSTGMAYISDSSDTWDFNDDRFSIGIEGRKAGRIIQVDTTNPQRYGVLPARFVYPNGLELSPDEQVLLVAETSMARILYVNLLNGFKKGIFAQNLPGLPDQIRASDHGTVWVGMMYPRHNYVRNILDVVGPLSAFMKHTGRSFGYDRNAANLFGRWGIAVELNLVSGNVERTVQDPKGKDFRSVTDVIDKGGVLYIGSDNTRFLGRIQDVSRTMSAEAQAQVAATSCLG